MNTKIIAEDKTKRRNVLLPLRWGKSKNIMKKRGYYIMRTTAFSFFATVVNKYIDVFPIAIRRAGNERDVCMGQIR